MNVVRSPYTDAEIPENLPYHELILNTVQGHGDAVGLVDGLTDRKYTYTQFLDKVKRVASGLARSGLRKGDVLCLCLPNSPEFVIAEFGALSAGATVTTVNHVYTSYEIERQFRHSNTKFVITWGASASKVKLAAVHYQQIQAIYVLDPPVAGCIPFEMLMTDDGSCYPKIEYDTKKDIALLPYSSGTTGLPKGVMLTHHNMTAVTIMAIHMSQTTKLAETFNDTSKVTVCVIPFFHIYGLGIIVAHSLLGGSKLVTLPKFEPDSYLKALEKYKPMQLWLVPPLVLFLAMDPRVKLYDLSSIQSLSSGAAPLSNAVNEKAAKRLPNLINHRVTNGFGLTETSGCSHSSAPFKDIKIESIGVLLPNSEGKVIDPNTGNVLGPNEDGEVCIKGPHIMHGYLNDPMNTAKTVDSEGWLHTGDIGHYDEEGFWYIVDRIKELIKYKGFQVAPAELEHVIMKHPAVADVAVIGVPDAGAGEVPKAYVVLRKNHPATSQQIMDFVAEKVARFKHLRGGVEFANSIPKNATGKIMRRLLKKQAIDAMQAKL